MSSMQNYLKDHLNEYLFRGESAAPTRPSSLWLCLFTAAPDKDGANGTEVDPTGSAYARVQCGPYTAKWSQPDSTTGVVESLDEFRFPEPTAAWGTITHWGIADAETGGNYLIVAAVTTPLEVTATSLNPVFPAGLLTFTWS